VEPRFRKSWKERKQEWVNRGWALRCKDGIWSLQQWLIRTPEGWALPEPAPTLRQPPGVLIEKEAIETPDLPPLPGGYEAKLLAHQAQPARQIYRAITCGLKEWGYPGALDLSDLGTGKAQPIDTPVLTPTGWKAIGSLSPGDDVISADGQPCKVLATYPQGMKEVFQVHFSDGSSTQCCDDHLWRVHTATHRKRKQAGKILSLKQIRQHAPRKWFIPMTEPVHFYQREALPIDPYLLGVILGDGCITTATPRISLPEAEMVDAVTKLLPPNHSLNLLKGTVFDYSITNKTGVNQIALALRQLGLMGLKSSAKFIPECYLRATRFDRQALMQGLFDTDGSPTNTAVEYSTSSPVLAANVRELVEMHGGTANTSIRKSTKFTHKGETRTGLDSSRLYVVLPPDVQPFRLARKQAGLKERVKYFARRCITKIEALPTKQNCVCIAINHPSRLYLTNNCIVTHNTYQCLAAALATGRRVHVICTVSTIPAWKRAFRHFGAVPGMIHNWEGLRTGGTYHAVAITELSAAKRNGPVANAYKWRLDKDKDILLCDEAHNARTVGSLNQALAFSAIRTWVPIIAISATMAVDPTHMRFCGRIVGLHRDKQSYFRFLHDNGCISTGAGEYDWKFLPGSRGKMLLANINRKIIPMRGARIKKEDLGDAFPKTQIWAEPIACEETDKIAAHWARVKDMTEKLIAKGVPLEAAERSLQNEYREGWQMSEMAKVPALVEMIREKIDEGYSVPVFMSFTASREKLLRELGSTCTIHGGQQGISGRKERQAAIDAFQEDREHAIIVQIAAGGTGVDMHDIRGERPRYAIHLPNPRPDHVIQALGRVQRAGGKSASLQVVLWAEGTSEQEIVESIRRKAMQINALNNGDSHAKAHF